MKYIAQQAILSSLVVGLTIGIFGYIDPSIYYLMGFEAPEIMTRPDNF